MSEPEKITLEKSRVVLKQDSAFGFPLFSASLHPLGVCGVEEIAAGVDRWRAYLPGIGSTRGTRDECLAWLDARILETRAALLPPGSVVLGPGAREREAIATALIGFTRHNRLHVADVVLTALRALAGTGTGTQAPPAGPVVAAPCQGQYHAPECRERSKPT